MATALAAEDVQQIWQSFKADPSCNWRCAGCCNKRRFEFPFRAVQAMRFSRILWTTTSMSHSPSSAYGVAVVAVDDSTFVST